ncbi:probable receptor-like protein kinase At1g80640 isoform X1 [Cucurbita pepo subsp. pepo]|uniref:probable receptor-like protein kinase At1g80640 isoform X1 n=1 Tax=Cucurbita pepo subsp. pepo TaxID=3664 RepID=UPI000C9D8191|nr:probable receptor-like protein kinase At1g80640 isoform X1 [Cucurbita pepo subsp. pepo]
MNNLHAIFPMIDARPELAGFSISHMVAKMEAQSPGVPEVIRVVHHQDLNKRILVALVVSSTLLGAILLFLLCVWIYRRRTSKLDDGECRKDLEVSKSTTMNPISRFNSLRLANFKGSVSMIDYKLLEAATDNFSKSNVLDEGSTGHVYKARFDDKMLAAVKRIDCGGPDAEREFENEVNWLCKIRHQNVIKLLGHCIRDETRFLVYEMMQNGSLESQLHGPSHGSALTWHLRMKIAVDIARGLEYLHEHRSPPVVHRDLKSSNILLDSDFNAKLSDFGLTVNLGAQNKNIKLSGTLGYVAPEYLLDGKLTDKSDVYAFGVVLLELLTGKKPVEKMGPTQSQSLVSWAIPQLSDRSKLPKVVDPVIRDTMDLKHLYQVAAVAVLCVQSEPSYRPLVTDVLHSLIPLVPVELGGSLRITEPLHLKEPSSTR